MHSKISPLPLVFALPLALVAGPVSAATLNLTPFADTFIRGGDGGPTTVNNFGSHTELLVGVVTNGGATNVNSARSLLSFNLNAPELIGATINAISLTFVTSSLDTGSTNLVRDYGLYRVTESFNPGTGPNAGGEVGVTWTSRDRTLANPNLNPWTTAGGTFNSTLLSGLSIDPRAVAGNTTITFDTSAAFVSVVQSALGGQLDLLLKAVSEDTTRGLLRFNSLNGSGTVPVLTIDYTAAAIPEPSAAAALGGLFCLGIVAVRRRRS